MATLYYADSTTVIKTEGPLDRDGRPIYHNSHYLTEQEAWDSVLNGAKAGVEMSARDVRYKRAALASVERELVEDTLRRDEAERNYRKWKESDEQ